MYDPNDQSIGTMTDFADLLVWEDELEEADRREDETRARNRRWRVHMRGSRAGSKPYAARSTTWWAFEALDVHRPNMVASTITVLSQLLTEATTRGANPIAYARRTLAEDCHLSESTTRKALARIEAQGWFTILEQGTNNAKGGTGRATAYLLLPQPTNPPHPSPHRGQSSPVRDCALRGPRSGPKIGGAHKDLVPRSTTLGSKEYLVSRPPLGDREHHENAGPVSITKTGPLGPPSEDVTLTKRMVTEPVTLTKTTADQWLLTYLSWGPMPRETVVGHGIAAGFSRATIDRAALRLRVVKTNATGQGGGKGKPPKRVVLWSLEQVQR